MRTTNDNKPVAAPRPPYASFLRVVFRCRPPRVRLVGGLVDSIMNLIRSGAHHAMA